MATVVSAVMQPNTDAIKAHLEALFLPARVNYPRGLIEIVYGERWQSAWFGLHEKGVAEAAEFAANRNREGSNIYVGVNPRKPMADRKKSGTDSDVEIAFWHFADLDDADAVANAGRRIRPLPPTMTVTTGTVPHRRPHLYWQLEEPVSNMAAWTERQLGIAQALDGDHVIDPRRILRIAGGVNFPTQKKLQNGYKVEVTALKDTFDEERAPVTPDEVTQAFPVRATVSKLETVQNGQNTLQAMAGQGFRPSDYIARIQADDHWHNNYRDLVAHWVTLGWTDAEIMLSAQSLTLPGYTVDDTERAVQKYISSARQKFGTPEPDRSVEETKRVEDAAEAFRASPFIWRAENLIPPRKWLYGRHLLRKFLSVDIAAGGVGKSSVKIGEALAMAANRSLYGKEIFEGPLRVWLYNLEDPLEETERRLHATAKRFAIQPHEVDGRLFVDSGRDQPCIIAEETKTGVQIMKPMFDAIVKELKERQIDVLIVDPFVSSHDVSENDNKAIDKVSKAWAKIADICNCSINLVHHVRKQNGTEATADSARGAKSLTDAARSVLVYNRMTSDEAENAGVTPEEASFIFRTTNDKANLSPPEKADWYRMNNTDLDNGDKVGVACPWQWPDPFDGVTTSHLRAVQSIIANGEFRESVQSPAWAGNAIAEVLNIEPSEKANRKKISVILKEWIKNGALETVEKEDERRKPKMFVIVGKWAGD